MRWLVLETAGAARAREAELSAATGYPRPATATDRIVEAISHLDGRGAVPVPSSVWSWSHGCEIDLSMLLTDGERAALYTLADMAEGGWFDTVEIL